MSDVIAPGCQAGEHDTCGIEWCACACHPVEPESRSVQRRKTFEDLVAAAGPLPSSAMASAGPLPGVPVCVDCGIVMVLILGKHLPERCGRCTDARG